MQQSYSWWLWIWQCFIKIHCRLFVEKRSRYNWQSDHVYILSKHHSDHRNFWIRSLVFTDTNLLNSQDRSNLIELLTCSIIFSVLPNTRFIRNCGYIEQNNNSRYERLGFGIQQIVCACNDKDNCNGSVSVFENE